MEILGATYSIEHYENFKKHNDNNYFEEIIDAMVLDGVAGMNEQFKQLISNLPKSEKRMAILSILDKDLNLFRKIKALTDKDIDRMDHIKDIIMMLRDYVKVGEVEKKKFGEVMTPLELVKEMLSILPEEVWSNPNLKWLDPANGTGPYPSVVIYKLMKGLENVFPDPEERYKHIVEKMIYVCELQPKNMFLYLCAVDPFDKYKLNIYTGSFLDSGFDRHMKEVWGVDKFDLIIGNPPYNDSTEKKSGTTGKKNLYQKFIFNSLRILINDGYLLFVTPPGFLKTTVYDQSTDIFNEIKKYNLLFLDISDINNKYFKVGTPICYFMIRKNSNYEMTKIKTDTHNLNVDIKKLNFVPRVVSDEIFSIIQKVEKKGIKFNFKREAKSINGEYITMKRLNHINKNGKMNPIFGNSIKYDLTHETDNPSMFCELLNRKLYRFLNYTLRHDGVIYHNFMNGLTYPINYHNMSDSDLYKFYNLSYSEIKLIEETIL